MNHRALVITPVLVAIASTIIGFAIPSEAFAQRGGFGYHGGFGGPGFGYHGGPGSNGPGFGGPGSNGPGFGGPGAMVQ